MRNRLVLRGFLTAASLALVPNIAGAQTSANPGVTQGAPGAQPPPPRVQSVTAPPPITLPPPATPPKVTFDRAVNAEEAAQIALRLQPAINAARGEVRAAQGRTEQARSGLLPRLGVTTGYNSVQTLSTENGASSASAAGVIPGFNSAVSVQQLLFDFNRTRDLNRQAHAFERAANQGLLLTQNDTVLQVKTAFYQYQQALRLVHVNEENVVNRKSQLDLANARFRSGLGQPLDVVTAETAHGDAVLALTTARLNAETARVTLAQGMGLDPQTPVQITDGEEPGIGTDDVNALVNTALAQRPEVRQAEENLAATGFGVSVARTTNAPTIGANLGFGSRGVNVPPGDSSFFVGVSVAFSPFDGGLTSGRVREARGAQETAQANLETVRLSVRGDVSRAYLALRVAEQNVSIAQSNVANARENVRIAEGRYRTGLGQFLDIINAQAFLLTAETNLTNAQLSRDQARAALKRALGQPFPSLLPQPQRALPPR